MVENCEAKEDYVLILLFIMQNLIFTRFENVGSVPKFRLP